MLIKILSLNTMIFLIGIIGIILNRKNIILMLMAIELMLLAINMNFVLFSVVLDDIVGQVYGLYILTVAASESAIGLGILITYYRLTGNISVMSINLTKN